MIKKSYKDVKKEKVTKANSTKTSVRWLITEDDGPTHFATRRFEIEPNGQIGVHNHKEEHHIYVLDGQAEFINGIGNSIIAVKDDIIYIPPNEDHGIKNNNNKPFVFICIIPYLG